MSFSSLRDGPWSSSGVFWWRFSPASFLEASQSRDSADRAIKAKGNLSDRLPRGCFDDLTSDSCRNSFTVHFEGEDDDGKRVMHESFSCITKMIDVNSGTS